MFSVTFRRDDACLPDKESLMSDETNTMRCKSIMSKAARKRFPGIEPYKGKSLTTNDLISQPKEDADGAGPAPEGGDAIGI